MKLCIYNNTIFLPFQSKFQSIYYFPIYYKSWLHLEKCLESKNPLEALSGEGWLVLSTKCLLSFTILAFFWAGLPQSIKIILSQSLFISLITSFVNSAHPLFLWASGVLSTTVKISFNKKTPY